MWDSRRIIWCFSKSAHLPVAIQGPKSVQLHQQLEERFAALPGVERVAPGSLAYISESMDNTDFLPEGESSHPEGKHAEYDNNVGIDFFPTLGIPILAGRGFGPQDTSTSPKVADYQPVSRPQEIPEHQSNRQAVQGGSRQPLIGYRSSVSARTLDIPICAGDPPPQFFLPYVQQPECRHAGLPGADTRRAVCAFSGVAPGRSIRRSRPAHH